MIKFDQPAYPTVYFSELIWVVCPECSSPAKVSTELPQYTIPFPRKHKSTCSCNNCGFIKKGNTEWFGLLQGYISQQCNFCGSRVEYISKPTKESKPDVAITCDNCNKTDSYSLNWCRYRGPEAEDPYFGLEILLKFNVKEKVLWIYNIEHLNYIRNYVQATLREDSGRHKYSLITNLPTWVKVSKNRDLIVSKLNKLKLQIQKECS